MNFAVFFVYLCSVFSLMLPNWFIAYSGDVMIRSYKLGKILANKKGPRERNERVPSQSLKFYYLIYDLTYEELTAHFFIL